jgi:hypothetical protein
MFGLEKDCLEAISKCGSTGSPVMEKLLVTSAGSVRALSLSKDGKEPTWGSFRIDPALN